MNKDFCVFILSNGRPDKVITLKTLKSHGYTGKVYIIIDNEDKTSEKYYSNFGKEQILVFDKSEIAKKVDNGDNFNNLRTTTHVRNAIFEKAKELNYKYFLMLDDDYTAFNYTTNEKDEYITSDTKVNNLDKIFEIFLEFFKKTTILSICFAQGGDFIGGENSSVYKKGASRKAMNSFFCSIDRPFNFISRLNEDVNTYMTLGNRGYIFITSSLIRLEQLQTQANSGGMTDAYIDNGTYVKSFYTVMYGPSYTKVGLMGNVNKRLHHKINWNNAVPVILDEKHCKRLKEG